MHERLGISREVLDAARVQRVTDAEARDLGFGGSGVLAGVVYPYVDPTTGEVVTHRVRRDRPEMRNGKLERKYLLPSGDRRHAYLSAVDPHHVEDETVPVVLVESEKSALMLESVSRRTGRSMAPVAIGGCDGWSGRIGKAVTPDGQRTDEKGMLPDIVRLLIPGRLVIVWLDADAGMNLNVALALRRLTRELVARSATVRVARAPDARDTEGPDDYRSRTDDDTVLCVLDTAHPTIVTYDTPDDHLRAADFDRVAEGIDLTALETHLRRLDESLRGSDALRRRLVRDAAVAALKRAKVVGAAGLIDAALRGSDSHVVDEPSTLPDDLPADAPVFLAPLLNRLADAVRRYVVLGTPEAADAIALWIVMAWAETSVSIMPILSVVSPTPRCGKSTTITVVGALAPRALLVSGITPAALFRSVEAWHPTLIVDEADTVLPGNEDLRGVLNAGHTRHAAVVIRCVGEDQTPTRFSVWCPKVLALIGRPPTTVLDRSIVIELRRKTPTDPPVARLRQDTIRDELADLRRACRRWANDHGASLRGADPAMPRQLHDRAADNWRALVAIADVAGEGWPARARAAACVISGFEDDSDVPIGVLALADIRDVWPADTEHVASAALVDMLLAVEDRPWKVMGRAERPLTGVGLARLLRPFGVRTHKVKRHGSTMNAYAWTELDEAITRYVPVTHPEPRNPLRARSPRARSDSEPRPVDGSDSEAQNRLERVARFRGSESEGGTPVHYEETEMQDALVL